MQQVLLHKRIASLSYIHYHTNEKAWTRYPYLNYNLHWTWKGEPNIYREQVKEISSYKKSQGDMADLKWRGWSSSEKVWRQERWNRGRTCWTKTENHTHPGLVGRAAKASGARRDVGGEFGAPKPTCTRWPEITTLMHTSLDACGPSRRGPSWKRHQCSDFSNRGPCSASRCLPSGTSLRSPHPCLAQSRETDGHGVSPRGMHSK